MIDEIITGLKERLDDVSFSQSEFQDKYFVEAAARTPARAYQTILIQIQCILDAVQKARFDLRRNGIEQKRLSAELAKADLDEYALELAQIDLEEKQWDALSIQKRIDDESKRLENFWNRLKDYGRYTPELFEAEESTHFALRLENQIKGVVGAREAIANVTEDAPRLSEFLSGSRLLTAEQTKLLEAPNV